MIDMYSNKISRMFYIGYFSFSNLRRNKTIIKKNPEKPTTNEHIKFVSYIQSEITREKHRANIFYFIDGMRETRF